ncbi:Protein phosphatase inhibitor 2 [Triplophysa tibetana]|uniref:Protein phosphatase inhibitor 2 n=1 Tax=Triplophysa tibetana TaxID=1572043 RepID=A0A5A9NUV9_9TELE|nr:Protein phosphatase inhibitor 2 [Triplophysa tibetana]
MAAPRPIKGILKNKSSSNDRPEEPVQEDTPEPGEYINLDDDQQMVGDDEDEGALSDSEGNTVLPGDDLAKKLEAAAEGAESRFMRDQEEETSEEEEEEFSPEEQVRKKEFQMMRKMHYNEGLNIKLARQLIANELEEEEDEDEEMKEDTEAEEITVDPPQDADSLDS